MALAVKASRGADMPWGLAEEAGFSVGWLHARDLSGVEALASLLEASARPDFQVSSPAVCPYFEPDALSDCTTNDTADKFFNPIALGASLLDFDFEVPLYRRSLGYVRTPLLLLPFLISGLNRQRLTDSIGIELDGQLYAPSDIDSADTNTVAVLNALPTDGAILCALVAPDQIGMTHGEDISAEKSDSTSADYQGISAHAAFERASSNHDVTHSGPRVRSAFQRDVERLTEFAHKTYAPATEYSRIAGAGAGTTDND